MRKKKMLATTRVTVPVHAIITVPAWTWSARAEIPQRGAVSSYRG